MTLNTEQIIKAMYCCYTDDGSCLECPFQNDYESCVGLNKLARNELERLHEENKSLKSNKMLEENNERIKPE